MKNILFQILLLIILFISSCVVKEDQITEKLFEKYDGKPGFYLFDVPPYLLNILIEDNSKKNKQLKSALEKLDNIKILLFKTYNEKVERKDIIFDKFNEYYTKNAFKELAVIKKYNEQVNLKFHTNKKQESELIILLSDKNSFVALSLYGTLDYNTFTTLLEFENIETLKNLKDR